MLVFGPLGFQGVRGGGGTCSISCRPWPLLVCLEPFKANFSGPEVDDEMLDRVLACVLQYDINGSRLLQVTERDLENLEIPICLITAIIKKLDDLRAATVDLVEFPSLTVANMIEAREVIWNAFAVSYNQNS